MTEKNLPFYEQAYTGEQQRIAEEVIALEKDALDKYFQGDMSGYLELWSKKNFTYVIHSTWDLITPFSLDVKRPKTSITA